MNGQVQAALLGAVVAGVLTTMTSLIDGFARRRDTAVAARREREDAATRRIAEALTRLVLLTEDPRCRQPHELGYDERCEAWERERDELIWTIDTDTFDISHGDVRDQLREMCAVLRMYERNVRPADEFSFRRNVVTTGREWLGAYRRGDELPPDNYPMWEAWRRLVHSQSEDAKPKFRSARHAD
ncbi:hypothetical protein O7630_03085 [Micromonospora sp. WMMD718]|uniref:hypothetical protein n=1 Tax=Micromonospora sp. WMMD718 TaxID=3016098 RepID=UPI002415E614|nr:hypothetical protein [Micromonospora sp. WMMD718]MDG4749917.1 hypothetical protein [Micromonospora sp. WMMD718]